MDLPCKTWLQTFALPAFAPASDGGSPNLPQAANWRLARLSRPAFSLSRSRSRSLSLVVEGEGRRGERELGCLRAKPVVCKREKERTKRIDTQNTSVNICISNFQITCTKGKAGSK